MNRDVIIACDFASREATLAFLDKFTDVKPFVKIGMELFYAEGPSIVKEIKARGHKIFLDLKLHDIPNTVKKAMAVLRHLDVDMTNLHASGTIAMMEAAKEAGLDGVVCSPLEAGLVKENCGKEFYTVTPGIRFADSAADDQVRVMTPARAREIGSDYIVVGRPITAAEDPVAAYRRCMAEFVG